MGVACCAKAEGENQKSELKISSTNESTKLSHCKTADRKERKRTALRKSISDAILITPSQFVVESQGVLSNSYQFKNQLGQGNLKATFVGSYGSVYEAVHSKTKERRAIKLIDKSLIEKDKEGELLSEIKVLKEMDHPSIMRIYEFASDKNYYYIVQE